MSYGFLSGEQSAAELVDDGAKQKTDDQGDEQDDCVGQHAPLVKLLDGDIVVEDVFDDHMGKVQLQRPFPEEPQELAESAEALQPLQDPEAHQHHADAQGNVGEPDPGIAR